MAGSFAMHLWTRRRLTSPTAIGLIPVFLFNAVNVALQKAWATKVGSWPLLAKFTSLVRNSLLAWIDQKLNNWLRGEDALGTYWTAQLLWNLKKTGAAKGPFFHRIDKLRSYSLPSAQEFRFPLYAVFWVQWGFFCCRVLFRPMIKSLPHDQTVPEDKVFSLGRQALPLCCCFYFLLASLKPLRTKGQYTHPISSAQIYLSLSFSAAAYVFYPLRLKHAKHIC